jgi:deoxyribonuclease V
MHQPPHPIRHAWTLSPREAVALQRELAERVIREGDPTAAQLVAGVDVGFVGGRARAAVAVLSLSSLELVDHAVAEVPVTFPYVPGLLSFREVPAVLEALGRVALQPDLLLCDGQGIAHPRRCGFASHLGLWTDTPTIGVAKSRLIGAHSAVPDQKGAWVPLLHGEAVIGAALRTRACVAPVYVSVGHRISLDAAIRCVLACTTRYRLPETTRWAHRLASGTQPLSPSARPKTQRRP